MSIKRYELGSETRDWYEDEYEVHCMFESNSGEYVKFQDLCTVLEHVEGILMYREGTSHYELAAQELTKLIKAYSR